MSPLQPSLVLALLIAAFAVGAKLWFTALGDAICSSYNFISNDLCDDWNWEPPPADAVPIPGGWSVASQDMSCGSGGCPSRHYVLRSSTGANGLPEYVSSLRRMGWEVTTRMQGDGRAFIGRKDDLVLSVESAARSHPGLVEARFRDRQHVLVDLALADEIDPEDL